MTGTKAGPWQIVAVGVVNGLIIGGGLALSHRANSLAVGLGIAAFITLTYAITCRKTAGQ